MVLWFFFYIFLHFCAALECNFTSIVSTKHFFLSKSEAEEVKKKPKI
jgi:hypothetical protein